MTVLISVLIIFVSAAIGGIIAPVGRKGTGVACGFFLGVIGWIIAANLDTQEVIAAKEREHQALLARRDAAVAANRAARAATQSGR